MHQLQKNVGPFLGLQGTGRQRILSDELVQQVDTAPGQPQSVFFGKGNIVANEVDGEGPSRPQGSAEQPFEQRHRRGRFLIEEFTAPHQEQGLFQHGLVGFGFVLRSQLCHPHAIANNGFAFRQEAVTESSDLFFPMTRSGAGT